MPFYYARDKKLFDRYGHSENEHPY
jgi:hypothetical protein